MQTLLHPSMKRRLTPEKTTLRTAYISKTTFRVGQCSGTVAGDTKICSQRGAEYVTFENYVVRRLYLHGPQNFCHSSSLFSTCQLQLCVHYQSLCSLVNLSQLSLSSLAIAILVAKKEERLRTPSISMQLRGLEWEGGRS